MDIIPNQNQTTQTPTPSIQSTPTPAPIITVPQKSKTTTYILIGVLAVCLALGGWYLYTKFAGSIESTPIVTNTENTDTLPGGIVIPTEQPLISEPEITEPVTFTNTQFGYNATLPPNWRVAQNFSKNLASQKNAGYLLGQAGCRLDSEEANKAYEACVKEKSPGLEKQFEDFQKNWTPENSDYVVLTSQPLSVEETWLPENPQAVSGIETSKGKVIEVYANEDDLTTAKEITDSKIKITKYTLSSGIVGTKIDSRELGTNGSLIIAVSNTKSWAKGLVFKTIAPPNSEEEKVFFELVNSLRL